MTSFTEKLDPEALKFFNDTCKKKHSEQAVAFLNAYWQEVGDQAEWIFSVTWEIVKKEDMDARNISLLHLYQEGCDFDFDVGLKLYESMSKFCEDPKNMKWKTIVHEQKDWDNQDKWGKSKTHIMTALARKKLLREKVDVNFDGRITMLEFLLDQYSDCGVNPHDFIQRSMKAPDEHPEVRKARLALEEVNERIRAYEKKKYELERDSQLPGVKGKMAINELAQLESSPLKEELNYALITAEAAVRRVNKLFGAGGVMASSENNGASIPSEGAVWWMDRDLAAKKKLYAK